MDKLCRRLNGGLLELSEQELSDRDINICDRCGELDYYPNLIWRDDEEWWNVPKLTSVENTLYNALCEECFKEFK
tara:strand:+ start:1904 stop:2128 length:225 start_codon:yes stop_codon:yes gene_type:complete